MKIKLNKIESERITVRVHWTEIVIHHLGTLSSLIPMFGYVFKSHGRYARRIIGLLQTMALSGNENR